jgi:hypothetical protein
VEQLVAYHAGVVTVSPEAAALVTERGGRLFVWSKTVRCCRGQTCTLRTSTEPDARHSFRRIEADGIELYVDLPRLPTTLEIDVAGRIHRSVRAYWNGLAWVD